MSDTNVQDCNCCQVESDCINGLCEMCSDYNYKLQKQSDLLTLGLLEEKRKTAKSLRNITLDRKEDGHWLGFETTKGNSALLRIESMEGKFGYVTWKAIMEWAVEQALKV